jgi:hypothetical protein
MISARAIETPDSAKQRVSGRLRALLGVLGLGGVCLIVMLASLQAWDQRRAAPRAGRSLDPGAATATRGIPLPESAALAPHGPPPLRETAAADRPRGASGARGQR